MTETAAPAPAKLPPVAEDWERALCLVAHPDDLEWGSAAAVARWTGQGKRVVYALATSGEAGIDAIAPEECGPLREAEERQSAAVVGVDRVEFLGLPDGVVEYGVLLRALLCDAIRRHRPEIVITQNFGPRWGDDGPLNQADHIAVGRATLDAVRDAANRWVFRDQVAPGTGIEPWAGVRQVWVAGSARPTHGVDITATYDRGVASLQAHRAYIDGLSYAFDPEEFLEGLARQAATRFDAPRATLFEVIDLSDG
ncbi:LmbE family N-acetylglucosaminyl deacetylase [Friedmanniella endophytica]|uniref:LmbE family N-acetylglucosaminyl deacetylase n=1 Tax=Microlunatus kandeliicorticis TaxID=1759536 RepID=A0A7W3ISB4_9ACTN|nr:PIG-L deacetylase family protein [Microlunatus kandeliicorticis]MBA8794327.1 LmbE family N-acetylglucosaminyl deacetylase [Microlunatus kandeliicorticis]